jgi:hypothetical protein
MHGQGECDCCWFDCMKDVLAAQFSARLERAKHQL